MSGFFASGQWWDVTKADLDAINAGSVKLSAAGIDNALQEARLLWAAAAQTLDAGAATDRFSSFINRRTAREPLSHLVGYRDFYKHRFVVSADVLDPRPETETLIEVALSKSFQSVLDLGTGTGCILLSLIAEREVAKGVGTDLSSKALTIAARNTAKLKLDDRTTLLQSDWYNAITDKFDLIVSNPPYIALPEMDDLQPEVRDYEPSLALTDNADGLTCYRAIITGAPQHLSDGGHLAVEIGPTQAAAVSDMMQSYGFADISVTPDLDGRDRVVSARYLGK